MHAKTPTNTFFFFNLLLHHWRCNELGCLWWILLRCFPIKIRSNSCHLQAWKKLHHVQTLDCFCRIHVFPPSPLDIKSVIVTPRQGSKCAPTPKQHRATVYEPDARPPRVPLPHRLVPSDRPAECKWGGHGPSRLTPRADRCGYNTSPPWLHGSQISGSPADAALAFVSSHIVRGCLTIHVVPHTPWSQHETHHLLPNLSAAVNWLKPEPEDQRNS